MRSNCIWSNLALHWHSRPDLVFPEWQRVLKVNGLLMFSTLGPDTLQELSGAYARSGGVARRARRASHMIDFVDMHDLGDMLVESGFEIPVMDQEVLTITYKSPESLLNDVRRWGAYPLERAAADRAIDAGVLRDALAGALEARRRDDGTIPLTFEVIYGHAWKAVPRMTAEGHGIVRLEDIGRGPQRRIGEAVKRASVMSEICVRKAVFKMLRQKGAEACRAWLCGPIAPCLWMHGTRL